MIIKILKEKRNAFVYEILDCLCNLTGLAFIVILYYLNYKYINSNNFLDILLFIIGLLLIMSTDTKLLKIFFNETSYKTMNIKDFQDIVDSLKKSEEEEKNDK